MLKQIIPDVIGAMHARSTMLRGFSNNSNGGRPREDALDDEESGVVHHAARQAPAQALHRPHDGATRKEDSAFGIPVAEYCGDRSTVLCVSSDCSLHPVVHHASVEPEAKGPQKEDRGSSLSEQRVKFTSRSACEAFADLTAGLLRRHVAPTAALGPSLSYYNRDTAERMVAGFGPLPAANSSNERTTETTPKAKTTPWTRGNTPEDDHDISHHEATTRKETTTVASKPTRSMPSSSLLLHRAAGIRGPFGGNRVQAITTLLSQVDATAVDPTARDSNGCTVLHHAATSNSTPVLACLLRGKGCITVGAKIVEALTGIVNARDRWGWTALARASLLGHGEAVSALLDAGADVRLSAMGDPYRTSPRNMMGGAVDDGGGGEGGIVGYTALASCFSDYFTAQGCRNAKNNQHLAAGGAGVPGASTALEPEHNESSASLHSTETLPTHEQKHIEDLKDDGADKYGNQEEGTPGMDYRRWRGFLPIHLATSLGRKTVVEKLLDHLDNSNDNVGELLYADIHCSSIGASSNDANVIKAAPQNRKRAPASWPCTENGQTLLVLAGEGGHEEVVNMLLARGADPAEILNCGCSILHHAVRWQNPGVVRSLRDAGAQVDALDEDGATPLFVAAFYGFAESVDVLLYSGAQVPSPAPTCVPGAVGFPHAYIARKDVYSPLVSPGQGYLEDEDIVGGTGDDGMDLASSSSVRTASYKLAEAVHADVESGHDPTAIIVTDEQHGEVTKEANTAYEEQQGITSPTEAPSSRTSTCVIHILDPLMAAAFHGHTRIVKSLLNANASESRGPIEKDGVYPLHMAAQESRLDVVRLLLSHGASVHARGFHGVTALHTAARTDAVQCMHMLLNAGAKVNARDEEGKSPLHHAALAGKRTAIAALLDRGADVSVVDEHGATPLGLAANADRPDAALLLLAHGADPTSPRSCGCPPMHDAAGAGGTSILHYLQASGASVDVVDCVGCFPLHRAAGANQVGAIATLVDDLGADVEARAVTGGITAAHIAAQEGSVEALEALLDRGALMTTVDDDGLMPIHYACQCGKIGIVRTILNRGVSEEGSAMVDTAVVDTMGKARGFIPLLMAASSGHTELMELLHSAGITRVALTATDASGSTALHLAASNGHSHAVELVLLWVREMLGQENLNGMPSSGSTNDANINADDSNPDDINANTSSHVPLPSNIVSARTEHQLTPLLLAASSGDRKTVALLLDAGAEHSEKCSRGSMPIHVAASVGRPQIVADLLGAGADPCAVTHWGETALHHAASCEEEGGVSVVRLLLRAGVPVQALDKDGWSALHTAAACGGQAASLVAIIEAGTNPALPDKNGWTPLHLAGEKGSVEAAKALIAAGALLDSASRVHNLTPLHQACTFGNVAVCQLLLDAGAPPEARDTRLRTPLHLAAANGHASIVDCLLSSRSVGGKGGGAGLRSPTLSKEHSGFSPLHLACEGGHEGATVALLAAGAPPDVSCDAGYTPMHQAAATGAAGALRAVLAASKISISARAQGGWTPVHLAAQNGHREALLQLAMAFDGPEATFDAMTAGTDCAVTPLHQAARNGHVAVTEILLNQFHVPPAPCDIDGETPLHTAAQKGYPCCIDVLRRAGAPLEVRSALFGAPTVLHDACASLRPVCVERLLWWGADSQAMTVVGASPAQLAWFAVDDILGGDLDGVGLAGWGDVGAEAGLDDGEEHGEELLQYGLGVELDDEEGSIVSEQIGESRSVTGSQAGEGAHHQGQQREINPVEAGLHIDSVLRRATFIRQKGERDRTWHRRGWLVIMRARDVHKERGCDASICGFTTTREPRPLIRGRFASAGGGGGGMSPTETTLSDGVDTSTIAVVNRVIDMSEVGLFRHIISYL